MVRPHKIKQITNIPKVTYFKPQGIPLRSLNEINLNFDEVEAIRLSDIKNYTQSESADLMQIHQSTFQRLLARARQKIADALLNGKAIKMYGGTFKMPNMDGTGPEGKGSRTGRGLGKCGGNTPNDGAKPRMGLGRGQRDGRGIRRRQNNSGQGFGRRNSQ